MSLLLTAMALVYCWGWIRLRNSLPNVLPVWRLAAFLSGVFSWWAAVGSPLASMDHELLTIHMVKHLLLMTVAAPLILLGAPAITLLHGLPQRFTRSILKILHWPPLQKVGRMVTHPVVCWFASTAAVIGWHVPVLFKLGMQPVWHEAEHACFFAAGLLFWWPVIQPWPSLARWPRWSAPLYLFLATLPCDALSAFLTFCGRVVYPHYLSGPRLRDLYLSPLGDQESAGALMWVWVTFVYLVPAVVVTIQMLSPQGRTSKAEVV